MGIHGQIHQVTAMPTDFADHVNVPEQTVVTVFNANFSIRVPLNICYTTSRLLTL